MCVACTCTGPPDIMDPLIGWDKRHVRSKKLQWFLVLLSHIRGRYIFRTAAQYLPLDLKRMLQWGVIKSIWLYAG